MDTNDDQKPRNVHAVEARLATANVIPIGSIISKNIHEDVLKMIKHMHDVKEENQKMVDELVQHREKLVKLQEYITKLEMEKNSVGVEKTDLLTRIDESFRSIFEQQQEHIKISDSKNILLEEELARSAYHIDQINELLTKSTNTVSKLREAWEILHVSEPMNDLNSILMDNGEVVDGHIINPKNEDEYKNA